MIYTHNVTVTLTKTGTVVSRDFTSLPLAVAWQNGMIEMYGIGNIEYALTELDTAPTLIKQAWAAADRFALDNVDRNEREQYLGWLVNPATPVTRLAKIVAISEWLASIWQQYYTVKARIMAGDLSARFDPSLLPPLPYTFADIATTTDDFPTSPSNPISPDFFTSPAV